MVVLLYFVRAVMRFHFFLFGSSATPPHTSELRSILISASGGIGDALMVQPVVRLLKSKKQDVRIDVLVSPATKPLYENDPDIHRAWPINTKTWKWLKLVRELRSEHYDAYIGKIPSNTLRKVLLPYLAGIRFRVKHRTVDEKYRDYDFLFHHIEEIPSGRHRVLCNLDLLKCFGFETRENISPKIELQPDIQSSALAILHGLKFDESKMTVGFHPGCNPSAIGKRWEPDKYAALGDWLQEKWNAQVILVGGGDDLAVAQKIFETMRTKPLLAAGQCSLLETAAVIERCRFFVSNDSGIMHLAAALEIPTFAIFGPTDDRHIGPFGTKHTVIRSGSKVGDVAVEQVIDVLMRSEYGPKFQKSFGRVSVGSN